jgi:hypothetical protein
MSDEQEQRRDPAGRVPQPDETRPFALGDESDENAASDQNLERGANAAGDGNGDSAATRIGKVHPDEGPQSGDAWVFDRSGPQPGGPRSDDPTAPTPRAPGAPRAGETSVMPAAGDDGEWGADGAPWSGRAVVRPPRPGEYAEPDWSTEPPSEPRGKWWMPILIGILGLLLLALLSWGIWLILQAQNSSDDDAPAVVPPTTAAVPATAATTAAAPTTEPPTSKATTAAPPPDTAVTIPALKGLSREEAQQALNRVGLSSRLRFVNSDRPAGTVIDSDPGEGQEVPPDTTVTLVIASQPASSNPTTATASDQPDNN